jgi:hypothetical protein
MKKVAKKRARRYDDGGTVSPLRGNFSTVNDNDNTDIYKAARARDAARENSDAFEAKIQELSNAPEKYTPTITLGGRPEYKEGENYTIAPSSKSSAAPSSPRASAAAPTKVGNAGRGSYKGYDTSKAVENAARQEFAKNTKDEALERVYPESYLNPGRLGTKAIMESAQALARGKGAAKAAAERVEPYLSEAAPYLKELPYRAAKMIEGYRPNFVMKKKGGTVKKMASGGSTSKSSASSRGDGIASRGKTRGKFC